MYQGLLLLVLACLCFRVQTQDAPKDGTVELTPYGEVIESNDTEDNLVGNDKTEDVHGNSLGNSDKTPIVRKKPVPKVDWRGKKNRFKNRKNLVDTNGVVDGEDGAVKLSAQIFYYVWYANPETDGQFVHWNHAVLPHWRENENKKYPRIGTKFSARSQTIGASFYPELGLYSSASKKTIAQHFEWMFDAGVNVVVLSWHGLTGTDGEGYQTNKITPIVFEVAEKLNMKICFHLEPYDGRTYKTIKSDVEYVIKTYGRSDALFRLDFQGKHLPLFYVYDSYHIESDDWKKLLHPKWGALRNSKFGSIFLGLYLDKSSRKHIVDSQFDGFYTYFASSGFTEGANYQNWGDLEDWAQNNNKLFAPSVAPGYNDTKIRPWNYQNTKSRKHGSYFNEMWSAAADIFHSRGEKSTHIVSITSFNEWGEGTQIEPARSINSFSASDGPEIIQPAAAVQPETETLQQQQEVVVESEDVDVQQELQEGETEVKGCTDCDENESNDTDHDIEVSFSIGRAKYLAYDHSKQYLDIVKKWVKTIKSDEVKTST